MKFNVKNQVKKPKVKTLFKNYVYFLENVKMSVLFNSKIKLSDSEKNTSQIKTLLTLLEFSKSTGDSCFDSNYTSPDVSEINDHGTLKNLRRKYKNKSNRESKNSSFNYPTNFDHLPPACYPTQVSPTNFYQPQVQKSPVPPGLSLIPNHSLPNHSIPNHSFSESNLISSLPNSSQNVASDPRRSSVPNNSVASKSKSSSSNQKSSKTKKSSGRKKNKSHSKSFDKKAGGDSSKNNKANNIYQPKK